MALQGDVLFRFILQARVKEDPQKIGIPLPAGPSACEEISPAGLSALARTSRVPVWTILVANRKSRLFFGQSTQGAWPHFE